MKPGLNFVRLTLCALIAPAAGIGQDSRGQIQGRVTDPSGAVISGATVRAINSGTNVTSPAATNQTGDYQLPFLLPGTYTVVVEAHGFKKWIREAVGVQVNDRVTLNVSLEVGSASETVQVTAEASVVDASSASLGTVVD